MVDTQIMAVLGQNDISPENLGVMLQEATMFIPYLNKLQYEHDQVRQKIARIRMFNMEGGRTLVEMEEKEISLI